MKTSTDSGILKRNGKALGVALATSLSSIFLFVTALGIGANIGLAGYSSNQEVQSLAAELDVDMSYSARFFDINARMQHNDGEPIYVCFDEELTAESTAAATEALDEIFDLVSEINPTYHYTIVDKNQYKQIHDKTKMYFDYSNVGEATGLIQYNYNVLSFLTDKHMYRNYKIHENTNNNNNEFSLKYLYMHELLHAFGIKDVYSNAKFQGNTAIKINIGNRSEMLTPNDYKLLIALYAPPNLTNNNISTYKQMAQKYSDNYYNSIATIMKTDVGSKHSLVESNFFFETRTTIYTPEGKLQQHLIEITIQDESYNFLIFDEQHQLIDSTSGGIDWNNGTVLLKDVKLKHGLYPLNEYIYYSDGFIDDFAIMQTDQGPALTQFGSPSAIYHGSLNELDLNIQNG